MLMGKIGSANDALYSCVGIDVSQNNTMFDPDPGAAQSSEPEPEPHLLPHHLHPDWKQLEHAIRYPTLA
jgi:hypothetical protein